MQPSNKPALTPASMLLGAFGAVVAGVGAALFIGKATFIPSIPAALRFEGDGIVLMGVGAVFMSLPLIKVFRKTRDSDTTRGPGQL